MHLACTREIVRVIVNDDEGDADVADDSDDVVGDC